MPLLFTVVGIVAAHTLHLRPAWFANDEPLERRVRAIRRLTEDRGATAGEKASARAALRRLRARHWFRSQGHKEEQALVGRCDMQVSTKLKARPSLGRELVVEGYAGGVVLGALTLPATMPLALFADWLLDLCQQSTLAVVAATWFAFDIALVGLYSD